MSDPSLLIPEHIERYHDGRDNQFKYNETVYKNAGKNPENPVVQQTPNIKRKEFAPCFEPFENREVEKTACRVSFFESSTGLKG